MSTLAEELKAKTQAAITEGERKHREKEAEDKAKDLAQKTEWNAIAHRIIAKISNKAGNAAESGLYTVAVHRLVYGRDYKKHTNTVYYNDLTGPAAIVYNYCLQAGLNPKIVYGWSGDGMDSWHDIYIDWS